MDLFWTTNKEQKLRKISRAMSLTGLVISLFSTMTRSLPVKFLPGLNGLSRFIGLYMIIYTAFMLLQGVIPLPS